MNPTVKRLSCLNPIVLAVATTGALKPSARRFTFHAPSRAHGTSASTIFLALALFPAALHAQAPQYTAIDLGTLGGSGSGANAINNAGQIVGYAYTSDGATHATLFSGTGTGNSNLGTLGELGSEAYAINNSGQIVGSTTSSDYYKHATLFSGTGVGNTNLGNLGQDYSIAHAINNSGQVVGEADCSNYDTHATLFSGKGVGNSDLGTLGGNCSCAYGINDSGQIVGFAGNEIYDGISEMFDDYSYATLFSGTGIGNTDLGTLGGSYSIAYGINNHGQIVGTSFTSGGGKHGFVYTSGPMLDLNSLITGSTGVTNFDISQTQGHPINDWGQIVGLGTVGNQTHAVLLNPVTLFTGVLTVTGSTPLQLSGTVINVNSLPVTVVAGGTLGINGAVTLNGNGTVTVDGGSIGGGDTVSLTNGITIICHSGEIDVPLTNNGTLHITGNSTNHAGGSAALVNTGTVTIDAGVAYGGMDSGGNDFTYNQNAGSTTVNGTLAWGNANGGTLQVAGGTLQVGGSGAVLVSQNTTGGGFTQTGGVTNVGGGTLDAGHGTIQIQGGTVNVARQSGTQQYAMGGCDSTGGDFAYQQTGGTVNLDGDADLWNPAVQGGALNIGPTGTLDPSATAMTGAALPTGGMRTNGSPPAAPLTISGAGVVTNNGQIKGSVVVGTGGTLLGTGTIAGDLTSAGTVRPGTGGTMSVAGNLTNSGTVVLTGTASISVGGTFTNNGVLDLINCAQQTLPAHFTNNGTVLYAKDVKVKQFSVSGSIPQLTIQSYAGHNYQLQRSGTLAAGSWQAIGAAQTGTGGILTFSDSGGATLGKQFYRITVTP